MSAEHVASVAGNARAFDTMIVAVLVLTAAIGAALLLGGGGAGLRLRRAPAWVLDMLLAAGAAAYVALGAVPLLRHLPFLYNTFPLAAAVGIAVIAAGFGVLLLRFVL